MSHDAKAFVLHCIDFRFIDGLNHWLDGEGLTKQYDRVALAGSVKNLVDPTETTDVEIVLRQIDISKKLHNISEVWLINHLDCGAYGKIFSSSQDEYDRHVNDLQQAKTMIEERHSDVAIKLFLAKLTPTGDVECETIV